MPTTETVRPASGLLAAGTIIADTYRIVRLLGAGGMGEVYQAEHLRLSRGVAVKILRSGSDQRAINRFRRETKVVASLESDHVVGVFDCGTLQEGTPYLVMELLRGEDLRAVLNTVKPLPVVRAVRIVQQAARGVAAAHRAGIVHRDLKPENLFLVRRDGDDELCKVLDFGVAKTETSELTQQGTVIGTIKYMAPEQLEDSTRVGASTDVYALGAILYECLTGAVPHLASTAQETMLKILTEPIPPLRGRRGEVPEALSLVVARALSRRPQDRYQSSAELERVLAPFVTPGASEAVDFTRQVTADLSGEVLPKASVVEVAPSQPDSARGGGVWRLRMPALVAGVGLGTALGAALVWALLSPEGNTAPALAAPLAGAQTALRDASHDAPPSIGTEGAGVAPDAQPARASSAAPVEPTEKKPRPPARPARAGVRSEASSQNVPEWRVERENPYGH